MSSGGKSESKFVKDKDLEFQMQFEEQYVSTPQEQDPQAAPNKESDTEEVKDGDSSNEEDEGTVEDEKKSKTKRERLEEAQSWEDTAWCAQQIQIVNNHREMAMKVEITIVPGEGPLNFYAPLTKHRLIAKPLKIVDMFVLVKTKPFNDWGNFELSIRTSPWIPSVPEPTK